LWGCTDGVPARETIIVNTVTEADLPLIRSRRELMAAKYQAMANDFYAYFRGTFPLYLRDATDTTLPVGPTDYPVPGALPFTLGDAHPENFGLLVASDGTFAIEGNDFDGADRYPYHWELRRLCTGMAVAARGANDADPAANAVSRDAALLAAANAARGYAEMIVDLDRGRPPPRFTEPTDNPIAEDLFDRGTGDWADREELDELTDLDDGVRTLKRGGIDPDDPANIYIDVPSFAMEALPEAITAYRATLIDPPPAAFFTILDAARELGSGVASLARVRIIILVRGETDSPDDDVILELKELIDSGARGWIGVGVSEDSVQERVITSSRQLWARPDAEPLWGTSTFLGFPIQIKHESEGLKTFRTRRFDGALGEPEALFALARLLGQLLARMHASSGAEVRDAIADTIEDDILEFAEESGRAGVAYADQLEADWVHFQNALDRLGPVLGVPFDPADVPSPELRALYGLSSVK
jgi:hypothetical protein